MRKKISIALTQKQYEVLTSALFEYSGVCESESHMNAGTEGGFAISRPDKSTPGYKIHKAIEKLLDVIHEQVRK